MKKFKLSLLLLAFMGLLSFTGGPDQDETILETVTYGICGCDTTSVEGVQVELTLRPDHTFRYINASDPKHSLDLNGEWVIQGKKVILNAATAKNRFHSSWKMDKNQSCIVSRNGLNFIRLCNTKACK